MRRCVIALSVLVIAGASLAQGAGPQGGSDDQDEIARLVKRLGAEDFDTREEAMKRLVEIGRKAVPALEKAAKSKDPETAWRAEEALKRIRGTRSAPQAEVPRGTGGAGEKETPFAGEGFERWRKRFDEWFEKRRKEWERLSPGNLPLPEDVEKWLKRLDERFDKEFGEDPFKGMRRWVERMEKETEELRKDLWKRFKDSDEKPSPPMGGAPGASGLRLVLRLDGDGKMTVKRFVLRDGKWVEEEERRLMSGERTLGAVFVPVPEVLRYHLRLAKGEGLMVDHLEKHGLLAGAHLQRGDIILKVDDKPITSVKDLLEAVKDKEKVSAEVIREGERERMELPLK